MCQGQQKSEAMGHNYRVYSTQSHRRFIMSGEGAGSLSNLMHPPQNAVLALPFGAPNQQRFKKIDYVQFSA